jgi:two-component system, LytTR family, sensor kinase
MQERRLSGIVNIIIHIAVWTGIIVILLFNIPEDRQIDINDYLFNIVLTALLAGFFYINYFLLVPKFLFKRKFILFFSLIIILILCFSCLSELSFTCLIMNNIKPEHFDTANEHMNFHKHPPSFDPTRRFFTYFINFVVSTGLKMTNEWFRNERQKRALENDKLSAELSMLKAQINPHFFFNVLNNICSLARSKSDDTETYIIKLSQLMRYNIYNQKEDSVLLSKEIQFIEDYIDIQKMRLDSSVEISFKKTNCANDYMIEPMLLFPFVENAFKHGISYAERSKIIIDLNIDQKIMTFSVINSISRSAKEAETKNDEGIGLKNVIRRLKILYPDKHEISIKEEENQYSVYLKLNLS